MKSHLIPRFKVFIFIISAILAIVFVKFDINRNQTLKREQICSESAIATVVYKMDDQKALYIYGTCGGYRKVVALQTTVEPEKKASLRPAPRKVGATHRQQYMIDYAWRISGGDEKFITMIEAESKWQPHQWEIIEKDGELVRGNGYGLCQVDNRYWADIQSDPKFKANWAYQVHICLKLWRSGVRFYGADKNNKMISRFWWSPQDDT